MTRKPYKYKIGDKVLVKIFSGFKNRKGTKHTYAETTIVSKCSAGNIKQYGTANGGWKREDEIFPLNKN